MRILILCHSSLVPPAKFKNEKLADSRPWRTEFYVSRALKELGHKVYFCGLDDELEPLREMLEKIKPHAVFNLLEEFDSEGILEPFVIAYLEGLRIPVTGCHSEGLIIAKNKLLTKKILQEAGLNVPLAKKFPKIVKLLNEESSRGISARSVVHNTKQLMVASRQLHQKYASPVFTEEYIEGREIHVAVLADGHRILVSPVWETTFGRVRGPKILSEKMKWDFKRRRRLGVELRLAPDMSDRVTRHIQKAAAKSYKALRLSGCARIDIRLRGDKPYVIEVNPNPDLAKGDEFSECMLSLGFSYKKLIQAILKNSSPRSRPKS